MANIYFNKNLKDEVWNKAAIVVNNDPNVWRKDKAGAWIKYSDYGKTDSKTNYGWQVDHSRPEAKQGSDDPSNLQPLHWANNEAKGDNYPTWKPAITSSDNHNIESDNLPEITEQ